jgi:hypothetical protein
MPEIEVAFAAELTDAEIGAITTLAGRNTREAVSALAAIALDEWLQWLVADDRPASLTELSKRRIRALLEARLLPEPATAPVLALRARLTLGQARYIVTALELENPASGTEAATGLARHLSGALAVLGVEHPERLTEAQIDALAIGNDAVFDAPRAEANLAAATHEELLNEKFQATNDLRIIDGFQPPKVTRRTDSYVRLSLRPHVAIAILKRLAREPA